MFLCSIWALCLLMTAATLVAGNANTHPEGGGHSYRPNGSHDVISPKVFIINLYDSEGESIFGLRDPNLLERNITVPGLSPLFPSAHCTADGSICQIIAGEGEINAATSMTALWTSPLFNLLKTYFLIAGVGGVDPLVTTIGSVTFSRFAVQVDLQYNFDTRDIPANFSTGWVPQGSYVPNQYPSELYGTEVFELNALLRDAAIKAVQDAKVQLNDTHGADEYRALFANSKNATVAAVAVKPPSLIACDSITSNIYYSGELLNDAFRNYTQLITNGTAVYCMSQQEDNALLESLLRGTLANRTDFSRVILMRTASDFLPSPPGITTTNNLFYGQAGYIPALKNLAIAAGPIIRTIRDQWDAVYRDGLKAQNYVGDIFGSLGGTPDFGPGATPEPEPLVPLDARKREELAGPGSASILGPRLFRQKSRQKRLPSIYLNL